MDNLPKLDLFEGVEDIIDFPYINRFLKEKQLNIKLYIHQQVMDQEVYWGKCHSLKNLMTIMTSKNGNKFGGYSPC